MENWLFWISGWGLLVYTYLLYPIALRLYGRKAVEPPPFPLPKDELPSVTLVVFARNESKAIVGKLTNILELDYPQLQSLVVSDGSTDDTADKARQHPLAPNVLEIEKSIGKTAATLKALKEITTDITLFTDATGVLAPESLHLLVAHLLMDGVGCVGGRVLYDYDASSLGSGFKQYQRVARNLRHSEGGVGSATVISGALHGAYTRLIPEVPVDLSLELAIPLEVVIHGQKSVYVADAICQEESRSTWRAEWRARVRMGLRSWRFLVHFLSQFSQVHSGAYWLHLVSHKILRWVGGPLWLSMGAVALYEMGSSPGACATLWTWIALIAFAFLGLFSKGMRSSRLSLTTFFLCVNLAYCVSLIGFVFGRRAASWVPEREIL